MPTREERKLATRDRIYTAAEKLFLDHGFEDTSVAQVTKKAKVAKGTFFIHFASKGALLAAMGEAPLGRALDMVESSDRRSSWPFTRQVDHLFRNIGRCIDESSDVVRAASLQRAFDDPEFESTQQARLRENLVELVRNGKRNNDLRADVLADRMADFLVGVFKLSLSQWAERGGSFERWLMESVRLAFDGLTPR